MQVGRGEKGEISLNICYYHRSATIVRKLGSPGLTIEPFPLWFLFGFLSNRLALDLLFLLLIIILVGMTRVGVRVLSGLHLPEQVLDGEGSLVNDGAEDAVADGLEQGVAEKGTQALKQRTWGPFTALALMLSTHTNMQWFSVRLI